MPELSKQESEKYLAHFPEKVSQELVDYATNEVFNKSRYIVTRRIKKQQYGYCTHCNKEFKTTGFKHNEKVTCPSCNSDCIAKASGRGRGKMIDKAYFVFYEKSVIDPNVIVARGLYAVRDYRASYNYVETQFSEQVWYVFDMKNGSVMFRECTWWGNWVHGKQGYERLKSVYCYFSKYNQSDIGYLGYSRKSIKAAVKGTSFSWSGWEAYGHDDMVKFFDLYTRYPAIEYITKLGFTKLIQAKLEDDLTYGAVNWRGKNLFKVLKLTKQEVNEIKTNEMELTFEKLKLIQIAKKQEGSSFSISQICDIDLLHGYYLKELEKLLTYGTVGKIIGYLSKQKKKSKQFYSVGDALVHWRDYIADCIKLEMDLGSEHVLYPKDLHAAHQNTIRQIKIKVDEKLNAKISKRMKTLNKYCFEYNGLMIRPAASSIELIDEGKALNHCVGGYADKYAKGEADLLVVRKVSEPDKPYFTVEIRKDKIIQARGKHNCSQTKDVEEFMEAFKAEKLQTKKSKDKSKVKIPA